MVANESWASVRPHVETAAPSARPRVVPLEWSLRQSGLSAFAKREGVAIGRNVGGHHLKRRAAIVREQQSTIAHAPESDEPDRLVERELAGAGHDGRIINQKIDAGRAARTRHGDGPEQRPG